MSAAPAPGLKSFEFRREREAVWAELERLVAKVEKKGLRALAAGELARLPMLYRSTLSSLSVARAISLDRALLAYLESLAARSYFAVYGTRTRLWDALRDFFAWRFPAMVRRHIGAVSLAYAFMILGVVAAWWIVADNPERYFSFVNAEYAQGRDPTATTAELRETLYDEGGAADALTTFATFLFSHNAKIGILSFALGFALGVPVLFLMFMNGLIVGAFAALFHSRGLGVDLWSWLLPHGVTELSAVALCGGAGLVLARALVFPGRHDRMTSLALRGREAGGIVLGAVAMLFIAGLIEGIFRQTVQNVTVRYAVAATTAVLWIAYFALAGRGRDG